MPDDLEALADQKADKYHIPKGWFRSLIGKGERGFTNPGKSPKGALGVGQLMPATATDMGVSDRTDPDQNLDGSARYAAELYRKYKGDTVRASAAYNAGPGAVDKAGGVPHIQETQAYVKRVGLPSADDLLDTKPLPSVDDLLDPKPPKRVSPRGFAEAAARIATPAMTRNVQETRPGYESFETLRRARAEGPAAAIAQDITPPRSLREAAIRGAEFAVNPFKTAADVIEGASAIPAAAVDYLTGRPVEAITGGRVKAQTAGDVASLAIPAAGEVGGELALARRARAAGASVEAMRANEAARAAAPVQAAPRAVVSPSEHQAAVRRLQADGVEPARHQAAGGAVKRAVEAAKSDYHVGTGIRASEQAANASFNRALYNKVLAPIGQTVSRTGPIGRDGVADVESRLGAEYQKALPHIKLSADTTLTNDLADIRTRIETSGPKEAAQFEAILNQDVLHHFGPTGMDGRTFKDVESDLLRQSREYKGSQDPNQRKLGYALEDTVGALRSDMERASDPKWRTKLRNINSAYAMFVRLQDAAAARKAGRGEITPADLLGAVKKNDRTVRKGSFARGDALLQGFAEDADLVLTPEVRDSGTPERQLVVGALRGGLEMGGMATAASAMGLPPIVGMAADAALAGGTNLLARSALQRNAARQAARMARTGPNYMRAAQRRIGQ